MMHEAFRISLGKLQFDRLVQDHHKREIGYLKAVQQLLNPLKIGGRLHCYRHADVLEGTDWLVVNIESSGQIPLLEEIDQDWNRDAELVRECDAAEHLARAALGVFRSLVSQARMSPTQFHRLLRGGKAETSEGLRMMNLAEEFGDGIVAVRSPQGRDDIARMHPMPRLVTLPEIYEDQFLIHMVGRLSAIVFRASGDSTSAKPAGKKLALHWGTVSMRFDLAARFYTAMQRRESVTIRIRETLNRSGTVGRLEWCPD